MTRDEQLDWLCRLRSNIQCYMDVATLPDDVRKSFVQVLTEVIEQEPCTDAVSRAELLKAIDTWDKFGYTETGCFVREPKGDYVPYIHYDDVIKCIKGMPPVTQKSKTGHWILADEQNKEDVENDNYRFICSECQCSDIHSKWAKVPYCWKCGAKMAESEDKE